MNQWGLINSDNAVVCIDNHDTQRRNILSDVITYEQRDLYIAATTFMFATSYKNIGIMSSFEFSLDQKDKGKSSGFLNWHNRSHMVAVPQILIYPS